MPEDMAQVRFYSRPCYRSFKSEQAGKPVYEPVDYVEIGSLGDDKQIVDRAVKPEDMTRFPRQWEAYQRAQTIEIDGTPLTECPRSAGANIEALKAAEDVEPKGALSDHPAGPEGGTCPWCDNPFPPRRRGGSPKRFCSKQCRLDFHRACRIWATKHVDAGLLPLAVLRNIRVSACTPSRVS